MMHTIGTPKSELYPIPDCPYDWISISPQLAPITPTCVSQETLQGQARPCAVSVSPASACAWVPGLTRPHNPWSMVALFTEWHCLSGTTLCWSLELHRGRHSFVLLVPQGWRLDNHVTALSLLIRRVTFLIDSFENPLLKMFLEEKTDYFAVLTCSTYYDMKHCSHSFGGDI